jgi:hypothetical protein
MSKPAYQRVTISVKQEHIDKGVRNSSCFCPIALAIKDQCKTNYCKVLGADNEFYLESKDEYIVFHLCYTGLNFAQDFDNGAIVKPVDVSMYIPLGQ